MDDSNQQISGIWRRVAGVLHGGYLLESVLLATLLLGPAIAIGMTLDMQHGSIADWVAGLGTTAAVCAAIVAARYAAKAYQLEFQRERRWDDEQRRSQAALVAGWLGGRREEYHAWNDSEPRYLGGDRPGIELRNASQLPVFQVVCELAWPGTTVFDDCGVVETLPPNDKPMYVSLDISLVNQIDNSDERPRVIITFTDAAGLRWRRDTGALELVPG